MLPKNFDFAMMPAGNYNLREVGILESTIETIDYSITSWLKEDLKMMVRTNEGFTRVPVLWQVPERAFQIKINRDSIPSLRINSAYKNMISRANNVDNQTLKSHLQEADWCIKSLQNRGETLKKVTECIVEHQRDFLEHGEMAMKPLILQDIADKLGMHESTISRATTRKYMHTPRGTYELKYFFPSHVTTNDGGSCSSTAIHALIKKLIDNELPNKPLSDNKISALLKEDGINVARRTIAKYRETMTLPPSNERTRF